MADVPKLNRAALNSEVRDAPELTRLQSAGLRELRSLTAPGGALHGAALPKELALVTGRLMDALEQFQHLLPDDSVMPEVMVGLIQRATGADLAAVPSERSAELQRARLAIQGLKNWRVDTSFKDSTQGRCLRFESAVFAEGSHLATPYARPMFLMSIETLPDAFEFRTFESHPMGDQSWTLPKRAAPELARALATLHADAVVDFALRLHLA